LFHTERVSLVITAGGSLELKDDHQMVALLIAAHHGHTEIAKSLITAGASLDKAD
jgi:ankyrin repeat protein